MSASSDDTNSTEHATETKDRRRLVALEIWAVLLVTWAPSIIVAFGDFVGGDGFRSSPFSSPMDSLASATRSLGVIVLILFLWWSAGDRFERLGLKTVPPVEVLVLAIVLGIHYFGEMTARVFIAAFPEAERARLLHSHGHPLGALSLTCAIVGVISSSAQQEFVRCFLIVKLRDLWQNYAWSVGICAVLFGLIHIYQGWAFALGDAAIGALLGVVFCIRRNIAPLIAAHIFYNLLVLLPAWTKAPPWIQGR